VELSISLGGSPLGPLTLQLSPSTPLTNENFLHHCAHSYAGTKFHRVIKGFMVQGGDFQKGDGTGGESKWGGKFADEKLGAIPHDRAGVLSMANSGPGTNGSQFFVALAARLSINSSGCFRYSRPRRPSPATSPPLTRRDPRAPGP
jgi:cyclophilin family peptidyl-prolyl cis-trans isomerase